MLQEPNLKLFKDIASTASSEELIWMNGFIAGLLQAWKKQPAEPGNVEVKNKKLTIVYGTETGNAKKLAAQFTLTAKQNGFTVKQSGLDQYKPNGIEKEEYFIVIVSTQGDGEPPANAKKFFDYLHENAPDLTAVNYAVLGLGDTAYPLFCKAAEDIDSRMDTLKATRVLSLQKCDVDFEEEAKIWFENLLQKLTVSKPVTSSQVKVVSPASTKKSVYTGEIITNINLNDIGSGKRTHHLEIATGEEVIYQPGDALSILPQNNPEVVKEILSIAGIALDQRIKYKGEEWGAGDLLEKKLNIVYMPERVIGKYAAIVNQSVPDTRIDLADLLKIYPFSNEEQFMQVIDILEPLSPRQYSIASSPGSHPGELHLTVAQDSFYVNENIKYGLCSNYLNQLVVGTTIDFRIHPNRNFRLPEPEKDIIMIGPGTGIAPFRSFLSERDALGSTGRNWLFFGEQHFTTDFLYQSEMQSFLQSNTLTRLSLAFSRDQSEKIYVQHKMKKHVNELWHWIESGAHIYVCGKKDPMSLDVDNALKEIISQQGSITIKEAEKYLETMQDEGRYVKDVY